MKKILLLIAIVAAVVPVWGQSPALDVQSIPEVSGGTLNLVLANKNGFVIAADSRRTGTRPFQCNGISALHCDDSQKLFRVGTRTAVVIAGFAAGGGDSPLGLEVAKVLRHRFGPEGLIDSESSAEAVAAWNQMSLGLALTAVGSLLDPRIDPRHLDFYATYAEIGKDGRPLVLTQFFKARWERAGPFSKIYPDFEVEYRTLPRDTFTFHHVGQNAIARAIEIGEYETSDENILRYYAKKKTGGLDSMSLVDLRRLAESIFRATKASTPYVGGETQIGVFSRSGAGYWYIPASLPQTREAPKRIDIRRGLIFERGDYFGKNHDSRSLQLYWEDYERPFSSPISHFFLANHFKDVEIVLDNNFFVRNVFENAVLKWMGGEIFFSSDNQLTNCVLELPDSGPPPPSVLSDRCEIRPLATVSPSKGALGQFRLGIQILTCSVTKPDGTVVTLTKKECEDYRSAESLRKKPTSKSPVRNPQN